jgi:hypothetical protein
MSFHPNARASQRQVPSVAAILSKVEMHDGRVAASISISSWVRVSATALSSFATGAD